MAKTAKPRIVLIPLPPEQPDCCAECPLCGLIPEQQRKKNSKKTHVCLGIPGGEDMNTMSRRGIYVRKSKRDDKHPLHRPCDERNRWKAWTSGPAPHKIGINESNWRVYRVPFDQEKQMVLRF